MPEADQDNFRGFYFAGGVTADDYKVFVAGEFRPQVKGWAGAFLRLVAENKVPPIRRLISNDPPEAA